MVSDPDNFCLRPLHAADMENDAVGSSAESPAAEVEAGASPGSSPVIKTKRRGLRRWRPIPREQHKEGSSGASAVGGAADEDSAQLHKRRIPLPVNAPKGKHEVLLEESSTASVESRFIPLASPPPPPPAKLDPSLGMLVACSSFSVGAGGDHSNNSEDRSSSKSSTAASAPRRHDLSPFAARDRAADRARSSLHGKNPCAARARSFAAAEAESLCSSVESGLRSSNAVNSRQSIAIVAGNGIHKVIAGDYDQSDKGQPRDELRSTAGGYYENGSVVGRLAQGSDSDADAAQRSAGKNGVYGSRIQSTSDAYAESILLLQRTQQALENEIKKFALISKESSDDFDGCDDDWSGSVHLEEPLEETSQNVKGVECGLEEASYLGQLFLEKTEAEIQSIILTRAAQTWAHLADNQIALYNAQKSLSGGYRQLELKLQHTKNRAVMLEEMAEKLKAECKDLSGSSEVLRLQSRASRVSLFCFIPFIVLFTALGTFLARLLPSPSEDVPT